MTKPDLTPWLNRIHHGDSLEIMRKMPSESVDLIITSPPYNLLNSTSKSRGKSGATWRNSKIMLNGYPDHDDAMPHEEYVSWQRANLTEMMRLLTHEGAIFYNHKWRVQGGLMQDRADIIDGFPLRQIIIWDRQGGFNNNSGYFIPFYEVIYMICQPRFRLAKYGQHMGNIWRIRPDGQNPHPAPFPYELPARILKATTGQVVLDPFMGSGTVALACTAAGRDYIGIEKTKAFIDMAEQRLRLPLLDYIDAEKKRQAEQPTFLEADE